jgi:hypothetical protein
MLERSRKRDCLSDLDLDRLMAGELDGGAAPAANQHLAGCQRCTARKSEIEADRDSYRAAIPPMPRRAPAAARPDPIRTRRWVWPLAAAAAAVALFVLWPRPADDKIGSIRLKGGASLGFYVQRDGRVSQGASGDRVHPGESIRFAATTESAAYLIVASIDPAGRISVYHPPGARAEAIGPSRDQLLPDSILLDSVLGTEVVYGFFCDSAVEVTAARKALAAGGEPALPGCSIDRVTLEKR